MKVIKVERVKGIEPSHCAATRQRILYRSGRDDCKQPKTEVYMYENMYD